MTTGTAGAPAAAPTRTGLMVVQRGPRRRLARLHQRRQAPKHRRVGLAVAEAAARLRRCGRRVGGTESGGGAAAGFVVPARGCCRCVCAMTVHSRLQGRGGGFGRQFRSSRPAQGPSGAPEPGMAMGSVPWGTSRAPRCLCGRHRRGLGSGLCSAASAGVERKQGLRGLPHWACRQHEAPCAWGGGLRWRRRWRNATPAPIPQLVSHAQAPERSYMS